MQKIGQHFYLYTEHFLYLCKINKRIKLCVELLPILDKKKPTPF